MKNTNILYCPVMKVTLPALLLYLLLANQAVVAGVACSAGLGANSVGDLEAYSEHVCGGPDRKPHSQSVNYGGAELFGGSIYCEYNPWWADEWFLNPFGHPYFCLIGDFYLDASHLRRDDQGDGEDCPSSSHPINLINGNKYKIHTDIPEDIAGGPLKRPGFTRVYNSQNVRTGDPVMGRNWLHGYQRSLTRTNVYDSGMNQNLGGSFNPLQSSVYTTAPEACINGFNEIVANAISHPSIFGSISRVINGVVNWDGNSCVIRDANGRYITNIPLKSHFESSAGTDLTRWVKLLRPDGDEYRFRRDTLDNHVGGYTWQPESPGGRNRLEQFIIEEDIDGVPMLVTTYVFTDENDVKEIYADSGQLLKVEYPNGIAETLAYVDGRLAGVFNNVGRSLQFAYTQDGHVYTVTDENQRAWEYGYDTDGRLQTVINPDGTTKTYHYENESQVTALTGLTDERNIRYSTFEYYPDGLAKSSYLGAPGALPVLRIDDVSLTYSDTFNTVTNSRGFASKYHFSTDVLQGLMTQYDGPECVGCVSGSTSYDHDQDSLNLLGKTEYGQNTTFEDYDENGNPGVVTEAVATPEERAMTYTYDLRYQYKVETITEPSVYTAGNKVTIYTYDDFGNTASVTINGYWPDGTPVSRIQSFVYNGPFHQLSQIDGPRTDVSDIYNISYYPDHAAEGYNRARTKKVAAQLGVALYDNITYTATGKLDSYTTGANLQADFTYYSGNDRQETQTLTDLSSGESRTTHWTYIATGEVETITMGYAMPEATTLRFQYDDARRLTRIYDGFSNYIEYELDTEGNVISETIHDAVGALKKTLNQSFDAYNRLDITTQLNETRNQDYSPDGTLDLETDGKNVVTYYNYDALRRLTSITQDVGGTDSSSANALTQFGYDVQDNLVSVTDPNGGQTSYVYDDLGNMLSLTSPDTGTTAYTHDEAGNTLSATDAKSQVFNYGYDALGRLLQVDAPGTADDITYVYDTCTNGAGRLCSVSNSTSTVAYAYTAFGETKQVDQTVNAYQGHAQTQTQISYTYDAVGRLQDVIYPSGSKITYTRDAAGNVYSVILNDGEKNLVTDSQYYPFGPERLIMRGNGSTKYGYMDQAYRTFITGNGGYFYDVIYYDANGNPATFYSSEGNKVHTYDALDRLDTSTGPFGSRDYDYDRNGNRVQLDDGSVTGYGYTAASNRLSQSGSNAVQLDPNGNTLSVGNRSYTFTPHNRLFEVFDNAVLLATYTYNGLGERVGKYTPGGGQRFVFDPDGKIIAETDLQGNVTRGYIYLEDELLALIEPGSPASTILYVHNDHLGTPHMLTDEAGVAVWSAVYGPFGKATVNEDLDGDNNTVTLNIRFPGQYYDVESGLHYNYFRYYDTATGRYNTSDPIGLEGGLNTYGYVGGNPLYWVDPLGLDMHSFDMYAGLGLGISWGTNPDNSTFMSFRLGLGLGGGYSYDEKGVSPGYSSCGMTNYEINGFTDISGAIGPRGWNAGTKGGVSEYNGRTRLISKVNKPTKVLSVNNKKPWFNVRAGISGGVEGTVVSQPIPGNTSFVY